MRPILTMDGRRWTGFRTLEVTRSVEAACGSFRAEGVLKGLPGRERSRVRIDVPRERGPSRRVLNGWVDRIQVTISKSGRLVSISGRDITSDLVDGTWPEWPTEWTNTTLLELARDIALPVGIQVVDLIGEPLRIPRFATQPGETGWDAIARAAAQAGVLAITTEAGRLALTRQTRIRAIMRLVEGKNVQELRATLDASQRFHRYTIRGQAPTTDEVHGAAATEIEASAEDPAVRTQRRMLFLADGAQDRESAQSRVAWEAKVRAARAETISVRVQGWDQGGLNQPLWVPWNTVRCEFPSLGIDRDLSVSDVRNSFGDGGSFTELGLVRPDAFEPEPVVPEFDLGAGLLEAAS